MYLKLIYLQALVRWSINKILDNNFFKNLALLHHELLYTYLECKNINLKHIYFLLSLKTFKFLVLNEMQG